MADEPAAKTRPLVLPSRLRPRLVFYGVILASAVAIAALGGSHTLDVQSAYALASLPLIVSYAVMSFEAFMTFRAVRGWEGAGWSLISASGAASVLGAATLLAVAYVTKDWASHPRADLQVNLNLSLLVLVNVLGLVGLTLFMPRHMGVPLRLELVIQSLLTAGSFFLILWVIVGREAFNASHANVAYKVSDVAYPVISATVLSLVSLLFVWAPRARRAHLLTLVISFAVLAIGMPFYTFADLNKDPQFAGLILIGPVVAVVAVLGVAVAARQAQAVLVGTAHDLPRPSILLQYYPYIVPLIATVFIAPDVVLHGTQDRVLLIAGLAVFVCILVHSLLAIHENTRLARRLDESAAIKTEMLRFISHEMASPITPLSMQAHMLAQKAGVSPKDPSNQNLEILLRSVKRLETLSTDVRTFSQIEGGKLELSLQTVDVGEELRKAVAAAQPAAMSRGVRLVRDDGAPWIQARMDRERIGQVLDNLLSNAIKFTPKGGEVRTMARENAGRVHILVEDTGLGLTPRQQNLLFTAFGRAHGNAASGMGLGLFISKGIVEAHSGTIWADSEGAHRGSSFHLVIPVAGPTKPAPPSPAAIRGAPARARGKPA